MVNNSNDKRRKYTTVIFLVFLCYYLYSLGEAYGFSICPDEFGYWTYAATMCNCDWSEVISLGLYYSYGYSLILFPIFVLCKNMLIAYRIAITINFLLIIVTYYTISYTLEKIVQSSQKDDKNNGYIYAAVAVFYPPVLFYARTTMVETLIMFVYVLTCYLLYKYLEKHKTSTLIFLIISLIYLYFLHLRTIGILISAIITIAISSISFYKRELKIVKQTAVALLIGVVLMAIGLFIKSYLSSEVLSTLSKSAIKGNDYAGQMSKVNYMLTMNGIIDLLKSLSGKILYSMVSTFTLAFWGIYGFAKNIVSKNRKIEIRLISLYIVLSTLAELGIASIATISPGRIDNVTYGRYHEFVFPILIGYGMIQVVESLKSFIVVLGMLVATVPLVIISNNVVIQKGLTKYCASMSVGMSYMSKLFTSESNNRIWLGYVFGCIVTLVIFALIALYRKKKGRVYITCVLLMIEIALAVRAGYVSIKPASIGAYRDSYTLERIKELKNDNEKRRLVYIAGETDDYIENMQFMLRDEKITVYEKEKYISDELIKQLSETDIVLIYYEDDIQEIVEKNYEQSYVYGRFAMYYN